MQDIVSRLPPELSLRIIQSLSLASLASFKSVCSTWWCLVEANEDLIYSWLAVGRGMSSDADGQESLEKLCSRLASEYYGQTTWGGVQSWKTFCRTQARLRRNKQDPAMYLSRFYPDKVFREFAWNMKVDLKERLLIETTVPGLYVYDLDTMTELYMIPGLEWYIRMEYNPDTGIAALKGSEDLQIWKLVRCAPGQDPAHFPRGRFIRCGRIPDVPWGTQFCLKDERLILCFKSGMIAHYDVGIPQSEPVLLYTWDYNRGVTYYLDHTPSTLVVGHSDVARCYCPLTGALLGAFPPPMSMHLAHYTIRRPGARRGFAELSAADVVYDGVKEPFDFEAVRLMEGLGDRTEWKRCRVDGRYLVMLSEMGRLFVCTDYEAVLGAAEGEDRKKAMERTCCYFTMELGPNFNEGFRRRWVETISLSICDGRVAFGTIENMVILPLPPTQTTAYTKLPHALCFPGCSMQYSRQILLIPDGVVVLSEHDLSDPEGQGFDTKSAVRILWFDGREEKIEDEDRQQALGGSDDEV